MTTFNTASQRPVCDHVRIATRASELALWQSRHVAAQLEAAWPGLTTELLPITTTGDRIVDRPLAALGGKGLFIKELEVAILQGQADLAVHSMKDVPWELPEQLHIAAILAREDPRDVLVSVGGRSLVDLPVGAKVGTSSLRRRSQLLALRPDLELLDLRGNVPTRLARLGRGDYAAIVLAAAGLKRLGLFTSDAWALSVENMLPAVGQGAIGIECRRGDSAIENLIAPLHDLPTAYCVLAERAMNARLGGSCTVPVAGYAHLDGAQLCLQGLVAAVDGDTIVRHTASGPTTDAARLGDTLGQALLAAGAGRILRQLHQQK